MNQENQVSLKEFNMLAGCVASFWYVLDMKRYYLPHLSSSIMTSEYLSEGMRGKVFRIEKKVIYNANFCNIKLKQLIQKNNYRISDSQEGIYQTKSDQSQCYTLQIQWIKCFLKPKIEDVGQVTKEDLEQFYAKQIDKIIDTTLFRFTKPGLLKRTDEQIIAIAKKKSEQKLQQLKQKVDKNDLIQCIPFSMLTNMKNNLKRRKRLNKPQTNLMLTIQCKFNLALIIKKYKLKLKK